MHRVAAYLLRRGGVHLATVALALISIGARGARAVEALDGRVELHGHVESQVRGISEKFDQELDLAQWYNVLNLEVEADVLPEGWGPFNLMTAFVRVEGRYDALYSEGICEDPVPVAADASPTERLLARLGRDPHWRPEPAA